MITLGRAVQPHPSAALPYFFSSVRRSELLSVRFMAAMKLILFPSGYAPRGLGSGLRGSPPRRAGRAETPPLGQVSRAWAGSSRGPTKYS
jgi:hypothetical protein